VEGVILLFDGGDEYCDDDPATGSWNQDEPISGFAWGAVYDVRAEGAVADRNIHMRLELLDEHDVGSDGGGPDHGVTWIAPPQIVR
jgi:hypothetical protein